MLQSLASPFVFAQQSWDIPSNSLLDDPKFSSVILAKVGPWNVTAQEFMLSYEYGPAFTKRESDSKKHYLTYMIYEKLLALDGYDRGLQSSPMVKEVLEDTFALHCVKGEVPLRVSSSIGSGDCLTVIVLLVLSVLQPL